MNLDGFPIDHDLSSQRSDDPEDCHGKLGTAGPYQTREAQKLTLADIQVDRVAGKKRRDDVPKLDPVFRVAQTRFGPLQIDIPANHEPDHTVMIDFRLLELSRVLSIPETDNAIGAGIDLHQAMRNIDHADPGALQLSDQVKEAICLCEG